MKQTSSSLLANISTTALRWMPCVEARDAPHAMRNCHASLTEVSPASWCTNTVAFPRGGKVTGQHSNSSSNRKAFAGWRCGMLPIPWLLDRRSIVPCVLPTTSIIPFAFLSSPGPSWMFPRRTKFAKSVEPSGMYP
jgi:hypothetical protein